MKVIPAIDILNRVATRNFGDTCVPFLSVLSDSPEPVAVALAYQKHFGFPEIYIADLDAINRKQAPNFDLYADVAKVTGCALRVDAAIDDLRRGEETLRSGAQRLIIGTETVSRKSMIGEAVRVFGAERVIVSVDLRGKHLLSACADLNGGDPIEFVKELEGVGVREIMVLDLPRAGTGNGINIEVVGDILTQVRCQFALVDAIVQSVKMDVLAGSGLGRLDELKVLREMGAASVTIARTLHEGEITPAMLRGLSRYSSCYDL
jgi:phosphoribosylformimino-5-aminoimidazole carboxamide ribotide isomerase